LEYTYSQLLSLWTPHLQMVHNLELSIRGNHDSLQSKHKWANNINMEFQMQFHSHVNVTIQELLE
jgi:hypothetical protein